MNLPPYCTLHLGLYLLANSQLRVPYDIAHLVNTLFQGEDCGVYAMLENMAQWDFLTIADDVIYLKRWPQPKSKQQRPREDNLEQVFSQAGSFHPLRDAQGEPGLDLHRAQEGLAGVVRDRDFQIFLKKWPHKFSPNQRKAAYKYWGYLAKTRNLPPLNLMLYTLEHHLPPKTSRSIQRWLKKQAWLAYWTPPLGVAKRGVCPHCGGSGRRILLNDSGHKVAQDCHCRGEYDQKEDSTARPEDDPAP